MLKSSIFNNAELNKRVDDFFNTMSEKRKLHTKGVIKVAEELAEIYDADKEKVVFAAKCHDFFRGKETKELNALIKHYGLPERYLNNPNLAHGKLAEVYLKNVLGIEDEDVINAVSYHTTGRPEMSLLEKIVFIADAIEPNRDYLGVEALRNEAYKNIDNACLMSLEGTIDHLKEIGMPITDIDKDTIEGAEFFRTARKGEVNDK